jgi:hypothetical protein
MIKYFFGQIAIDINPIFINNAIFYEIIVFFETYFLYFLQKIGKSIFFYK